MPASIAKALPFSKEDKMVSKLGSTTYSLFLLLIFALYHTTHVIIS